MTHAIDANGYVKGIGDASVYVINAEGYIKGGMVHNHHSAAEGGVELWPDRLGVGTISIPAMDGVIGLAEASGHPLYAPNEGRIYVFDDGGDTELWYGDDKGRYTQITADGGLNVSALDHGTLGGLADDDHTQYLLADGTRALTGPWDVGAQLVTFGAGVEFVGLVGFDAGIYFDGASGVNLVKIPDGQDAALILRDGGPVEYLRIDTAPQLEIDFNNAGEDIDIYFRSVGVVAMFIQGSDGAVSLHGPSMDVDDNWWLGGSVANARIIFDFTPAPDQIILADADLNMGGANVVIPDAQADAIHVVDDTTGINFQQFVTTAAAQATVFNIGEADVDFRAAASGLTNALLIQGSDGQVTLGALGAGVVQASSAGVLSSGTVAADMLDMGIGDMLFNAADGLLLLGPHCEITPTAWTSLRKQVATISGAFHQENGRWLGTRGLVVEKATTNMILNPSFEIAGNYVTRNTPTTIARTTDYARYEDYSLHLATDSAGDGVTMTMSALANAIHTLSVWVRGTVAIGIVASPDNATWYVLIPAGSYYQWTRFTVEMAAAACVGQTGLHIAQNGAGVSDIYLDGFQVEQSDYATSYCDGDQGTGYAWTGAAHGSTSTRTVTEVALDDHVGLISGNNTFSIRLVVQMPYDADATWPGASSILFDARAGVDDNNRVLLIYSQADDKFYVFINGNWRLGSAVQTFKAGDWVDIIVTLDFTADDYNIYVNGLLEDNDTTALAAPVGLTLMNLGSDIGAIQQGGFNFVEFAIIDRVPTAIEAAGMYAMDRPLVDAGSLDKPGIYILDGRFHLASPTFVIDPVVEQISVGMAPTANGVVCLGLPTESCEIIDAGSAGATEQDWIEVEIEGVQGYLHVFAAK